MSAIVDAHVPAAQFALEESLRRHPGATFEIVRLVANTSDSVMPFLWGSGAARDDLVAALRDDPTTESARVVTDHDGNYLFRIGWRASVHVPFDVLLSDEESTLIDAHCTDGAWHFRLILPDHRSVRSVRDECDGFGLDLDVERVYRLSESFKRDQFELTEKQYETMLAAYDAGYYDVPREINLKELARQLDVSHQALSERLRRGHQALIANGLGAGADRSTLGAGATGVAMTRPQLGELGTH